METIGTLRISLFMAEPNTNSGPVRYTRRTLYTAHCITLDQAIEEKRHFEQLNDLGNNGLQVIWQPASIELE